MTTTTTKTVTARTTKKTHLRKLLLADWIELLVLNGYCIQEYIYKPLSYYNYKAIASQIIKMRKHPADSVWANELILEGEIASK